MARLLVIAAFLCGEVLAGEVSNAPAPAEWPKFLAARSNHLAHPQNADLAWKFARAAYDWAELATKNSRRAAIAREGIDAARLAAGLSPKLAAGHFYLGMNLGQLARTKTLGALPIVQEMERCFLRAAELDERFDYAGPHRSLGMLYQNAPGWPASIGHRGKARRHLEKAVALFPDHPENRLALLEAWAEWGDETDLAAGIREYQARLPPARQAYLGEEWQSAWVSWDERWRALLSKSKAASAAAAESKP